MDNNVLFINVGRGIIVDEEVFINVFKDWLIRYVYLDVFEKELFSKDNFLYDLDNVIIIVYIIGNDFNNNREVMDIFKKNFEYFFNNYDVIENKVDLDYGY